MSVLRCFCLLCTGLLLLAGGCDRGTGEGPVLLTVGDRKVYLPTFQREFREGISADVKLPSTEQQQLVRSYLRRVIDREMILDEADRLGIEISDAELDTAVEEAKRDYPPGEFARQLEQRGLSEPAWKGSLRRSLRVEKTITQAVRSKVSVDDAFIETYYHEHPTEFDQPQKIRLRQIVLQDEDVANEVLGLLQQGGDFAALTEKYSAVPEPFGDGPGWIDPGMLPPEIDDVVFKLPVGRVSELVTSPYGIHLFLVEESRPPGRLSLDQAAPEIAARLREEAEAEAVRAWLAHLRASIPLQVDWDLLAQIE